MGKDATKHKLKGENDGLFPADSPLKFLHQIARMDAKRFGDFHQRVNGGRLFAAFNLADVIVMQIRLLGQFLLA
jgi:hypothetical protein